MSALLDMPCLPAETGDGPTGYNPLPARGRGRPRKELPGSASDVVHVRRYYAPNWFTPRGVCMKRSRIEAKGLPDFSYWRLMTLTLDPKRDEFGGSHDENTYGDPLLAYLRAKSRLRGFLEKCRKAGIWKADAPWAWKLEFHRSGWAHWHLLVGRKEKMTVEEMRLASELWAMGEVHFRMVEPQAGGSFSYGFKYVFKPSLAEDEEGFSLEYEEPLCAPDWFMNFFKSGFVDESGTAHKPQSFSRVRFWQTSRNFYTGEKRDKETTHNAPSYSIVPEPACEQFQRQKQSVTVIARRRSGRYVKSAIVTLACCFSTLFLRAGWAYVNGHGVILDCNGFVMPVHEVLNHTTINKAKLWHVIHQNRMTLYKARQVLSQGQRLSRC